MSAYNTALLNIAMICALLFARDSDEMQIVYIASYGVLVGGVAQIALHIYPLYRLGFVRLFVCGVGEVRWLFSQGIQLCAIIGDFIAALRR
ncbi:integral membrane protein MviN [Helicobacter canis]|uniref:Integral membrane protein MviN n=1 Tax=Helicobacter canis TaxID=29419 RepID=A0A377JND3_9HELI|nr:integral membrane protein MviN [Helicobacter canis]